MGNMCIAHPVVCYLFVYLLHPLLCFRASVCITCIDLLILHKIRVLKIGRSILVT